MRRRRFALAPAFPGILEGQFWPLNLAILLLMRGGIARKVDAGLMKMIEFEKIYRQHCRLQKSSDRRQCGALFLTQTKGIHRRLIIWRGGLQSSRQTPRGVVQMKIRTGIAAAALLVASGFLANAQQKVTVIGCPTPGVEANCMMIRGTDNKTYNISAAKQRPDIGQRAVRLTGTTSRKLSYCQQGIALDNIAWSYTEQNCK